MKVIKIEWLVLACFLSVALDAGAEWKYTEIKDKVRGETTYFAKNKSSNNNYPSYEDLSLDFSLFKLRNKSNVSFQLNGGVSNCFSPNFCNVKIKFDDGKILEVKASNSVEKIELLTIKNSRFLFEMALLAKKMQVELPVSDIGLVQFSFDLSGFKWKQEFSQTI